ncbi:hypothetical protein D9758_009720 [Tetrapyrgos nigripes]|uniref:Helicase ATP-binding domain-containing protein n=1 Tax=Tetrapyrgos nigripes TaxID=182062 RepID=A0A8H5CNU5_9AGAR|nr:hypothetical protein D9758_009720 [Tetrapyrgos nigripes]
MTDSTRVDRLTRFLTKVLSGKPELKNEKNFVQFLEAICVQSDAPSCMDQLIAGNGLRFVQRAMHSDLSISFLNGLATDLLVYLQKPEIQTVSSGQYLEKTILAIVDPPIFWTAYTNALKAKELSESAQRSFAWLLLQLLTLPSETTSPYLSVAEAVLPVFSGSPIPYLRDLGHKIKKAIAVMTAPPVPAAGGDVQPGGQHDNDFADFRQIAILPTANELASTHPPFLRPSSALNNPSTEQNREALYLDNQFRLMREDMIHEMHEELQIVLGKQKGRKHRNLVIEGVKLVGVDLGEQSKRKTWGMVFQCAEDFPQLKGKTDEQRKKYWRDKESAKILKNGSLTCLMVDGDVVAFPSVRRDEVELAKNPPQLVLEMEGQLSITTLLLRLESAKKVKLIQIDVALFSYDPILNALKRIKTLPLSEELLFWKEGQLLGSPDHPVSLSNTTCLFDQNPRQDIQNLLQISKSIVLDGTQAESLLCGLAQNISIIQGPSGTGKSFIGALLAKFLHQYSDQKILVVCYTNHALDQFLEDLLDMFSPERLNVLLSRARNAIIIIGNSNTFTQARKGKELWQQLLQLLREQQHVYHGFPVKCEGHPDRVALLQTEDQFDTECPDGGCSEPCGVMLSCGQHTCPLKCHKLPDHSKMACQHTIPSQCPKGHDKSRKCSDADIPTCKKCDRKQKAAEARQQKEFARRKKLQEDEAEHSRRVAQVEEGRRLEEQTLRDLQLKQDRDNALSQKQQDLQSLKDRIDQLRTSASKVAPPSPQQTPVQAPKSASSPTSKKGTGTVINPAANSPSATPPSGSTGSSSLSTPSARPSPKSSTLKSPTLRKTQPTLWNQLQADKAATKLEEELRKAEQEILEACRQEEERQRAKELALAQARKRYFLRKQELKRQREENARKLREKHEAELKAKREAEEQARKREEKVQKKLREMGVCPRGYQWIKQSYGYRCAGGSHFVSHAELSQRELQHIREEEARRARERREAELKARCEAEEKARKKEAQAQQKLRSMGICVAGFQWIKSHDGYRCAGGSHFVSDAQLGL